MSFWEYVHYRGQQYLQDDFLVLILLTIKKCIELKRALTVSEVSMILSQWRDLPFMGKTKGRWNSLDTNKTYDEILRLLQHNLRTKMPKKDQNVTLISNVQLCLQLNAVIFDAFSFSDILKTVDNTLNDMLSFIDGKRPFQAFLFIASDGSQRVRRHMQEGGCTSRSSNVFTAVYEKLTEGVLNNNDHIESLFPESTHIERTPRRTTPASQTSMQELEQRVRAMEVTVAEQKSIIDAQKIEIDAQKLEIDAQRSEMINQNNKIREYVGSGYRRKE